MQDLLVLRSETVTTKEIFLNPLCRGRDEPEVKIIDVFACQPQHKLGVVNDGEHYIETTRGCRYCLRPLNKCER